MGEGAQSADVVRGNGQADSQAPSAMQGRLIDHFRVLRLLNRGGMGEVFLARDLRLGRRVALKLIAPRYLGSAAAIRRFVREAQATAQFSHPNIVTIHAVGEFDGRPYLALEYLEGEDLSERLTERPLSVQQVLRIMSVVAEALGEAHAHGVLHRDLKPGNIVIPRDGRPRVVDFGLAKRIALKDSVRPPASTPPEQRPLGETGVCGTPAYMAPEQWLELPNTSATDVWALGIILYELCTGRVPFAADSTRELAISVCGVSTPERLDDIADVPAELATLVERCFDRDPDARPSAIEVAQQLRDLTRGERIEGEVSPFRGLLPFTERHAALFFGRDAEIDALVERLRGSPLIAVVGPSGAGKSSLVRAGVVPRLHEQGEWHVLQLRPGAQPFRALASRLLRQQSHTGTHTTSRTTVRPPGAAQVESELASSLADNPHQLGVELRAIAERSGTNVLLVVDQLEELFTLVGDADLREQFVNSICLGAVDIIEPVRVVFTIRDDFLGRLAISPAAREALTEVMVIKNLAVDELERILTEPLEAVAYRFDDEQLATDMVASVGAERTCLPLLQFAAQMLWERRDRSKRVLTRAAYERMGGVGGALARHADGVLDGFGAEEQGVARDLVLRLVTPERTRRTISRERALEGLDDQAATKVLERLTEARLVSVRKVREGGTAVELAHESLVKAWSTLARWIDESREELSLLDEAEQVADLWDKRGRRSDDLWHGDALRDGLRMLSRLRELPSSVRDFLAASRAHETRLATRKRWLVAAVTSLSILVAAAAAVAAFVIADKESEAVAQRDLAETRREQAQQKQAEALTESARADLAREDFLAARGKLRTALELRDSSTARALWWRLAPEPLLWAERTGGVVYDGDFTADGTQVISVSQDGGMYIYDVATAATRIVRGHGDQMMAVDRTADGKVIATGGWDGRIVLWEGTTGRQIAAIDAHAAGILDLNFDQSGRRLVSAGIDRQARVWDVATREELARFEASELIPTVDIDDSGERIIYGLMDGSIQIGRIKGQHVEATLREHRGPVIRVRFAAAARTFASAGADRAVRIWDTSTRQVLHELNGHRDSIAAMDASSDGRRLVSGDSAGHVIVWDLDRYEPIRNLLAHNNGVAGVHFGPNPGQLLTTGRDRRSKLWDLSRPGPQRVVGGHADIVPRVRFSADSSKAVSVSADETVIVWDVAQGTVLSQFRRHRGEVRDAAFAGDLVVSVGYDQVVRIWDARSGAEKRALTGHSAMLTAVAVDPARSIVASGADDGTIRLWDLNSGEALAQIGAVATRIYSLEFAPDGKWIAASLRNGAVVIYDAATTDVVAQVRADDSAGFQATFSPAGDKLITSGIDRTIRIWSTDDWRELDSYKHDSRVYSTAIHPDGERVVLASADHMWHLWKPGDAKARSFRGHRQEANTIRVSGDGQRALTCSDDGTVRVWSLDPPMPYWRGPVLLADPPRSFSHRGWRRLDQQDAKTAAPDWGALLLARVEGDARSVAVTGDVVCIHTFEGVGELWRRGGRAAVQATPDVEEVLAIDGACVARAAERVMLMRPDGPLQSLLERAASAMVVAGDRVWLAVDKQVIGVDLALQSEPIERSAGWRASALAMVGDELIVGYPDGNVEIGERLLDQMPAASVTRIIAGPMETLIVGHANGHVGIWDRQSATRLGEASLNGAVLHTHLSGERLYVVTELGDSLVWDLTDFYRDRCELLNALWQQVPVVWHEGRLVAAATPGDHPCAK